MNTHKQTVVQTSTQATEPVDPAILQEADRLGKSPDILAEFETELRRVGVIGNLRAYKLAFLASYTRFFDKPVSLCIKGNSAAGKSHILNTVLKYVPVAAYIKLTGMSQKALQYMQEPLKHRHLVVAEMAGLQSEAGNLWLRSLLSEGELKYAVPIHVEGEGHVTKIVNKEGPTGLLMTTTETELYLDDSTRMLSISISNTIEDNRNIVLSQAEIFGGAEPTIPNTAPWHVLHDYIDAGSKAVSIPYLKDLASKVSVTTERMKRDWPQVIMLIKASALLHQGTRIKTNGQIIASKEDYRLVHGLVADLLAEQAGAMVASGVRAIVDAVTSVTGNREEYQNGVPQKVLAQKVDREKGVVSRFVNAAIKAGFIEDKEPHRKESKLVVVNRLPEDEVVLPDPDDLN